jgi:hypothetical protein
MYCTAAWKLACVPSRLYHVLFTKTATDSTVEQRKLNEKRQHAKRPLAWLALARGFGVDARHRADCTELARN